MASPEVGGQAVLGRQLQTATPWLTERHGYDPTSGTASTCVGSASCRRRGSVPNRPPLGRAPEVSPSVPERHGWPARISDSTHGAPGGLRVPKAHQASVSSAYAASASSVLAVEAFQMVLPGIWAWARCNSFFIPVEVGGQAVLGRQLQTATPWLTERHGYDPTCAEGASSER